MASMPKRSAINRWRIDPADVAVRPPVDEVNPAAGAVQEHHHRRPGQVQFHHRLADRQPPQRLRCLRNDHRIEGVHLLVVGDRPAPRSRSLEHRGSRARHSRHATCGRNGPSGGSCSAAAAFRSGSAPGRRWHRHRSRSNRLPASIPESRCSMQSVRKPDLSLPIVTWPEKLPSKYLRRTSSVRSLIRSRSASLTLMPLPDTRIVMSFLAYCLVRLDLVNLRFADRRPLTCSNCCSDRFVPRHALLVTTSLHR